MHYVARTKNRDGQRQQLNQTKSKRRTGQEDKRIYTLPPRFDCTCPSFSPEALHDFSRISEHPSVIPRTEYLAKPDRALNPSPASQAADQCIPRRANILRCFERLHCAPTTAHQRAPHLPKPSSYTTQLVAPYSRYARLWILSHKLQKGRDGEHDPKVTIGRIQAPAFITFLFKDKTDVEHQELSSQTE